MSKKSTTKKSTISMNLSNECLEKGLAGCDCSIQCQQWLEKTTLGTGKQLEKVSAKTTKLKERLTAQQDLLKAAKAKHRAKASAATEKRVWALTEKVAVLQVETTESASQGKLLKDELKENTLNLKKLIARQKVMMRFEKEWAKSQKQKVTPKKSNKKAQLSKALPMTADAEQSSMSEE